MTAFGQHVTRHARDVHFATATIPDTHPPFPLIAYQRTLHIRQQQPDLFRRRDGNDHCHLYANASPNRQMESAQREHFRHRRVGFGYYNVRMEILLDCVRVR